MARYTSFAFGNLESGRIFFVILVSLLYCSGISNAQIHLRSYSVQQLRQDDGLSQGANYFAYEDSRGFMWLTANDAINRYDGSMVKVYNLKRYFRQCPPLQQGYGFAEDDAGNIYIGSIKGLYVYHPDIDKFTLKYIFPGPDKLTMPFACRDGYVWCFNRRYDIVKYSVATGQVISQGKIPLPPIQSVHIYNVFEITLYERWPFMDKNGTVWIAGEQGLYAYEPTTEKLRYIQCPSLHCCYYNRDENAIMIGTESKLLLYDISTHTLKTELDCTDLNIQTVNSVCFNRDLIVFNTYKGLLAADRHTKQIVWLKQYVSKFDLSYTLRIDKAGRVWACDDGFGMSIYDFNPPLLPKISSDRYATSLISTKGVSQFAELPDHSILTHKGVVFDAKTKQMRRTYLPVAPDSYNLMMSETDKNGAWIFLNTENKLKLFLLGRNNAKRIFTCSADSFGVAHSLKTFDDGSLLVSFSAGLFWFQHNKLIRLPRQPHGNPFVISRLSGNKYAISYLDNNMWLARKDAAGLHFLSELLPGVQSFYMAEDSLRKKYWVATNQGVYLLDSNLRTRRIFDANTKLAGTYIYGLLLDDEGNVWCSHQRGLSSINTTTLRIINYDKSDGIQDWDYNNRAFYKATDGTLYFGGVSGFNYFRPPLRPGSFYNPSVYVDEIMINGKLWQPDTNADLIRHLELSHVQNNISVKAVIKDLMHGASRQLIYRIRQADVTWKELTSKGMISLNSLAPGDYILEIGIIDKYRSEPAIQKKIFISITAPFYLKSWFMVLLGVCFSFMVIQVFLFVKKNRKKLLLRQQLALEQQRDRITADLHDDIGASLSSLQINSIVAGQLIDSQPVQARRVLDQIAVQSKDLLIRMGDIIWSMKPAGNAFMSLSTRIGNFASEIMGNTDIHYHIDIDKDADSRLVHITLRRNILLIVKEAVNNAVKHSTASWLLISLKLEQRKTILQIEDNGKGFDTGVMSGGNGLSNLKQRALEINAHIDIRSVIGKGTIIILEIPV